MPQYSMLNAQTAIEETRQLIADYKAELEKNKETIADARQKQLDILGLGIEKAASIVSNIRDVSQNHAGRRKTRNTFVTHNADHQKRADHFITGVLAMIAKSIALTYKVRSPTHSRLYNLVLKTLKLTPEQFNDPETAKALSEAINYSEKVIKTEQKHLITRLNKAMAESKAAEAKAKEAQAKFDKAEAKAEEAVAKYQSTFARVFQTLASYLPALRAQAVADAAKDAANLAPEAEATPAPAAAPAAAPAPAMDYRAAARKGEADAMFNEALAAAQLMFADKADEEEEIIAQGQVARRASA